MRPRACWCQVVIRRLEAEGAAARAAAADKVRSLVTLLTLWTARVGRNFVDSSEQNLLAWDLTADASERVARVR